MRVPKPPANITTFIILLVYEFFDGIYHILELLIGHAGIDSYPEGIGHDTVGNFQRICYSIVLTFTVFLECGMLDQVACKKVSCLYFLALQIFGEVCAGIACIFFHRNEESKPAWLGILLCFWKNKTFESFQSFV